MKVYYTIKCCRCGRYMGMSDEKLSGNQYCDICEDSL